jgi:hypothetical protein
MNDLGPRPSAAVEYWFWKLHVGNLAFLVDVIIRRRTATAETRISLWVADGPRIEHAPSALFSAQPRLVTTEHAELTPTGSRGTVADITWDLWWDRGAQVIPALSRPIEATRALDIWLELYPRTAFSGSVTIGSVRYEIDGLPGVFMHYWGRRLADRWLWVSASRFDDDVARRVEVLVPRSRMYGRIPNPMPVAFAWLGSGAGDELVISPLNGLVRHRRRGTGWVISVASLRGRRHSLVLDKGIAAANDLGEGIIQTLRGNLTVDGIAAATATVGVETRGWPL